MNEPEFEGLGEPDLRIAGLRLWIHGRQFPDATDFWDGNWLRVTACCAYANSTVTAQGSFVHLRELVALLRGCQRLYESLQGRAGLDCIEPNLHVEFAAETGGHIRIELEITPDHMKESHKYVDAIDQTFLPPVISACRCILEEYPVREPEKLPAQAS
jgi:hypothetical protein